MKRSRVRSLSTKCHQVGTKGLCIRIFHEFNGLQQYTDGRSDLLSGVLTSLALVLGGEAADVDIHVAVIAELRRAG